MNIRSNIIIVGLLIIISVLITFLYIHLIHSQKLEKKGNGVKKIEYEIEELRKQLTATISEFPTVQMFNDIHTKIIDVEKRLYSLKISYYHRNFLSEKLFRIKMSLFNYNNIYAGQKKLPVYIDDSHGKSPHHWIGEYLCGNSAHILIKFNSYPEISFLAEPNELLHAIENLKSKNTEKDWNIIKNGICKNDHSVTAGAGLINIKDIFWISRKWARNHPDIDNLSLSLISSISDSTITLHPQLTQLNSDTDIDPEEYNYKLNELFHDHYSALSDFDSKYELLKYNVIIPSLFHNQDTILWRNDTSQLIHEVWINHVKDNIPQNAIKGNKNFSYHSFSQGEDSAVTILVNKIEKLIGNDSWILDITLDYFACNYEAYYTTAGELINNDTLISELEIDWFGRDIEKEIIDKRLNFFAKTLAQINKAPLIITIGTNSGLKPFDSAFINMDDYIRGEKYTPPDWTGYILYRVQKIINELYPETRLQRQKEFSKELCNFKQ